MPKKYPPLTVAEVRAILKARGFRLANTKGSHEHWVGEWGGKRRVVTVDGHHGDFDVNIIKSMIAQSGMTREEFYGAMDETAKKIQA